MSIAMFAIIKVALWIPSDQYLYTYTVLLRVKSDKEHAPPAVLQICLKGGNSYLKSKPSIEYETKSAC